MLKGVEIKDTQDQDIILKICQSKMCLQRALLLKLIVPYSDRVRGLLGHRTAFRLTPFKDGDEEIKNWLRTGFNNIATRARKQAKTR